MVRNAACAAKSTCSDSIWTCVVLCVTVTPPISSPCYDTVLPSLSYFVFCMYTGHSGSPSTMVAAKRCGMLLLSVQAGCAPCCVAFDVGAFLFVLQCFSSTARLDNLL
jgi:hypothetical protein